MVLLSNLASLQASRAYGVKLASGQSSVCSREATHPCDLTLMFGLQQCFIAMLTYNHSQPHPQQVSVSSGNYPVRVLIVKVWPTLHLSASV